MNAVSSLPRPLASIILPTLESGDEMSRAEFERRYALRPDIQKAELIEGVVYVASPVSALYHGGPHAAIMAWLSHFWVRTAGTMLYDNSTVRLDMDNEPQPDALLMIVGPGGQAGLDKDGYVAGAPELAVEVSASSSSIDLKKKFNAYRRNGIKEYVVWRTEDEAIDWFILRGGDYDDSHRGRLAPERGLSWPPARGSCPLALRNAQSHCRAGRGTGLTRAQRFRGQATNDVGHRLSAEESPPRISLR